MLSSKALSSGPKNRFSGYVSRSFLASLLTVSAAVLLPAQGSSQATLSGFEDTSAAQQDVFYRGTDQHIHFRYYNSAQGWQVQDVTTLSGAPSAAPATAVSSFKDTLQNQQHVVFEAANGHIYQAYSSSNPSSWSFQDVTSITSSGGAAIGTPLVTYSDSTTGVQYVFYIGLNQHVNVLYWLGTWAAVDASSVGGAVPAALGSTLTGFYENQSHAAHVFYEAADQHIHELYTNQNPGYIGIMDNSGMSGATPAINGSPLTGYFDNGLQQENLFFLGIDQHIHHLFYKYATPGWQAEDVTELGSGIAAGLGSSLSSFQDVVGNQQHVFYVGADNHLHQFYYAGSWHPNDVTASLGAQVPALTSPLTSFKDDPDGQQHAFYLGVDNHFYHVWFSNQWNIQDLTAGATVPAF